MGLPNENPINPEKLSLIFNGFTAFRSAEKEILVSLTGKIFKLRFADTAGKRQ
jgi:hypothetical protein